MSTYSEELKKELEDHLTENSTIKRAVENLNNEIYFDSWCKPLLAMIEYKQLDESNLSYLEIWDKSLHIEHIFPRGYNSNKAWSGFHGDKEIVEWINSGANLTLLSGAKNIAASNEGFPYKIGAYKEKGFYNSTNEGITSFRITQQIVDDYNSNSFNKAWNWDAIHNRWNWFCGEVEAILSIYLSEIKQNDD